MSVYPVYTRGKNTRCQPHNSTSGGYTTGWTPGGKPTVILGKAPLGLSEITGEGTLGRGNSFSGRYEKERSTTNKPTVYIPIELLEAPPPLSIDVS